VLEKDVACLGVINNVRVITAESWEQHW